MACDDDDDDNDDDGDDSSFMGLKNGRMHCWLCAYASLSSSIYVNELVNFWKRERWTWNVQTNTTIYNLEKLELKI